MMEYSRIEAVVANDGKLAEYIGERFSPPRSTPGVYMAARQSAVETYRDSNALRRRKPIFAYFLAACKK